MNRIDPDVLKTNVLAELETALARRDYGPDSALAPKATEHTAAAEAWSDAKAAVREARAARLEADNSPESEAAYQTAREAMLGAEAALYAQVEAALLAARA